MDIALYHGYELIGSGSNEYNRYLARALLELGHNVHMICREKHPERIPFINEVWQWKPGGQCARTQQAAARDNTGLCILHRIPQGAIYPVYLTDKQRPGNVRSFVNLSDAELQAFIAVNQEALGNIFATVNIDILYANHLVMQPAMALEPCQQHQVPMVFFLHGSAIEYTVKKDKRYQEYARQAIVGCTALVSGNREVRNRLLTLFPDLHDLVMNKTRIIGIGVDTSLFVPIAREQRKTALKRAADTPAFRQACGKSAEQSRLLQQSFEQGEQALMRTQFESYDENAPDSDISTRLEQIQPDVPVILFVGALTAGKGLQSLICAMPLVLAAHPHSRLLIIGSGAYREVLEALVYAISHRRTDILEQLAREGFDLDRSDESGPWPDVQALIEHPDSLDELMRNGAGLSRQVDFLGRMNHEQLSLVFPLADVAVFPSVVPEAYGLVLMEALANGVFPLVSYFSGFRDGIDELEQFLAHDTVDRMKIDMDPARRIRSIADNINGLITLSETHDFSSDLAAIAREHYDWKHRAVSLGKLFAEVRSPAT